MTIILVLSFLPSIGFSAMQSPEEFKQESQTQYIDAQEGAGSVGSFIRGMFFVYQKFVGRSKGMRCPMWPSCSEFARVQFEQRGIFRGILAAGDRLNRCGHDLHLYDPLYLPEGVAYEDYP